jgi:hypothetical protein
VSCHLIPRWLEPTPVCGGRQPRSKYPHRPSLAGQAWTRAELRGAAALGAGRPAGRGRVERGLAIAAAAALLAEWPPIALLDGSLPGLPDGVGELSAAGTTVVLLLESLGYRQLTALWRSAAWRATGAATPTGAPWR